MGTVLQNTFARLLAGLVWICEVGITFRHTYRTILGEIGAQRAVVRTVLSCQIAAREAFPCQ
jgi:hypothetical protein